MIQIVAYNPHWQQSFESEALKLQVALGANCVKVHWIGSTSVAGLAAKPIIDIIPEVRDILTVDACSCALEALGYTAMGESGMAFRRFFRKANAQPAYHVHVFEAGNDEIERHLRFRDYMRTHPQSRDAYAALKRILAQKCSQDPMGYGQGKVDFINDIERKTGFEATRMVLALHDYEWQAYHHLCSTHLGAQYKMLPTRAKHWHHVLYHGPQIIGASYLERFSSTLAILHSIVIDPPFQHQGYGQIFLSWLERWLTHQGLQSIRTQACSQSYTFFTNMYYVELSAKNLDSLSACSQALRMRPLQKLLTV